MRRRWGEQPSAADFARLMRLVEPCAHALATARAAEAAGAGIAPPARRVMERLEAFGPHPVPKLAGALDVTRQAIQPIVDSLVVAGHVELWPNAANRRSPLVRLTDEGRALVLRIRARDHALDTRMAARFLAADVAIARRTLENLVYAYSGLRAWEHPRMRVGWSAGDDPRAADP